MARENYKKIEIPVIGRTYSLYGGGQDTNRFYELIETLADELQEDNEDSARLIDHLQMISRKKLYLKKILNGKSDTADSGLMKRIHSGLQIYITGIDRHLSSLPLLKKWDWALSTTREQYYIYMLEFSLVNRLNKNNFRNCGYKIALLPHCVRDLSRDCLSKPGEIDYVCKGCSKVCSLNNVSKLLKKYGVDPYIWKTVELKQLFKMIKDKHGRFGVLGIACVPELIRGMRRCSKHNIPVVGIPLDANRCRRWMGEFYDNTVNIEKLEKLLA